MAEASARREDRITTGGMAAYGLGHFGASALMEAMLALLVAFYATHDPETGGPYLSIGAATFAVGIGRFLDAFLDPLVGYWTDRIRTRWGRRAPVLAATLPPMCLFFALMWLPLTPSPSVANLVALTASATLFVMAFTAYMVPYLAWLPDLARSVGERTRAMSWMAFFNVLGVALGSTGAGQLAAVPGLGFGGMGLILAGVTLVTGGITLGARLHRFERAAPRRSATPIVPAIRTALANPHFRRYLPSFALFWVGLRLLLYSLPFFIMTVFGMPKGQAAAAMGTLMGCAIGVGALLFPVIPRLAVRWGKTRLYRAGLALFCLTAPLLPLVGLVGDADAGLHQAMALMALAGIPTGIMFVIPYTLLADVIDYDEDQTGTRREALYFGVQGLFVKVAQLAGLGLGGLLVGGLGATSASGPRLAGPVAAVFVAAGLLWFRAYALQPRDIPAVGER